MASSESGLKHLISATKISLNGLRLAFRDEAAIRQEVLLYALLIPVAFYVDVSPLSRIALLASPLLVFIAELINSSIEATVDRIGLERHELSGKAKDIGSAAVAVALLFNAIVWGGILAWG